MAEKTDETNIVGRSPEQFFGRNAKSLLNAGNGNAVGEEGKFWEAKGVVPQKPQENRESFTPVPEVSSTPPPINQEVPNTPIRKPNILTRAFSRFISKLHW